VDTAIRDEAGLQVTGVTKPQPVFSVTKMFVATAVLKLTESGQLGLDDEVSRQVPLCPKGVTVRELLSHTGGLPDYATDAGYVAAVTARDKPWNLERIAAAARPGNHAERGKFRYSNLGYWLLGEAIERTTGKKLAQTLTELVFEPTEMTDTTYPTPGEMLTETGYDTRWAGPAGATWSTPTDLTKFLTALRTKRLLSKQSWQAMTTRTAVATGHPWRAPAYGLGLMIDTEYNIYGHSGGGPEYTSAAFTTKTKSVAIIAGPTTTEGEDPTKTALKLLN
jgi:CubicO group peptidase (beta-lactamase class C family)